jgi:hypothetical protein
VKRLVLGAALFAFAGCGQVPPPRTVIPAPIIIAASPPHVVVERTFNCAGMSPVYLTEAEIKGMSSRTLTTIVNNNNEGQQHCGWKNHTTPQEKPNGKHEPVPGAR